MDAAVFWDLIERSRPAAAKGLLGLLSKKDPDPRKRASASPDLLRILLNSLPDGDVAEFARFFNGELVRLNRWEIWGAGYVISGGMGDDSFHYFRSWLIGKGKAAVEQALSDPDGLGSFVDDPEVDNELLEYVALEVLEGRGLEGDLRVASDGDADGTPAGEPFDEDTVDQSFPRLAKQFGD